MGAFRSGIEVEELFAKISGFKSFRHKSKVHDPSKNEYWLSFVETPRKFVVAKLSIRKLGSSSTDQKLCNNKFTLNSIVFATQTYKELIIYA